MTIEEQFFHLLKTEENKETLQNWLYQTEEEEMIKLFGEEHYVILIAENYFDFSCEYLKKYLIQKLLPQHHNKL